MDASLEELPEGWTYCTDEVCRDCWASHKWFEEGIKSGIPLCCVIFFHDVWMPSLNAKMGDEYADKFINGYIPCPDCVERIIRGKTNNRLYDKEKN